MIYKQFQDIKLSALGLGCMRLPRNGPTNADIDEPAVERMVAYALEHGINYFDTAWGYHDGNSELVMGRVLKKHPRNSFFIASKFPGFDVKNMERHEEIFNRQLEKLQIDYFDFYLAHNVAEKNVDAFLDQQYNVMGYLVEQKKAGRIRHLGFSTHGNLHTMRRFLEAWGHELEFCQIQLNWLDWEFQDAKAKVDLISEFGIPVWVMEPVRGGSLVNLAPETMEKLEAMRPGVTAPEWAFRFIQSIPQVCMTLSGMSNDEQLAANIATFESEQPLSETEWNELQNIAKAMISRNYLPCTRCSYCTEQCPQGLPIPLLLSLYSDPMAREGEHIRRSTLAFVEEAKQPHNCIGCRACEFVCPQNIKISEVLADFNSKLQ